MKTKIKFIRNATMKITYGGKTFLTDPMLAPKKSYRGFLYRDEIMNPTSELPISIEEILQDIDAVFVSHSHIPAENVESGPSDHFDSKAIDLLDKTLPVFIQAPDSTGMKRVGFNNVTAIHDIIDFHGIKVSRFSGLHADITALQPMVGEVSGYVFQADGYPTMLWTGDTILTDEVKQAIATFNPEIIIIHSGGAQLPIDDKGNVAKLVMDDLDTIAVAELAPDAKIIAIHMEALDHCPVTREGLRSRANAAGIHEEMLLIPEDGETIEL